MKGRETMSQGVERNRRVTASRACRKPAPAAPTSKETPMIRPIQVSAFFGLMEFMGVRKPL
jgi:hypothetical protein